MFHKDKNAFNMFMLWPHGRKISLSNTECNKTLFVYKKPLQGSFISE